MNDFENLLFNESFLLKNQIKWKRSLSEAKIALVEEVYTLTDNDNKRELIYNKQNKLIGTKAYKIDTNKNIIK